MTIFGTSGIITLSASSSAYSVTWQGGNGQTISLSDGNPFYVLYGQRGMAMPLGDVITRSTAGLDGAAVTAYYWQAREIDVPILIKSTTRATYGTHWRRLAQAFDTRSGDGKLTIQTPNGDTRWIHARYRVGLERVDEEQAIGLSQRATVTLRCDDPFFYSDPIVRGLAGVGSVTLNNPGDVTSWPVWRLTNVTGGTITNVTTGEYMGLNGSSGTIVIDSHPRRRTMLSDAGVNCYNKLTSGSDLFGLVTGDNTISFALTGIGGGTVPYSPVTVTYHPTWVSV